MPDLTVTGLAKSYGSNQVLAEVDFTVPDGQLVTLLGPSGCGKTTTLMSIAGFTTPDAGHIACGERVLYDAATGTQIPAERRDLGIVFQSYALWPHFTTGENAAYPLKIRRTTRGETRRRVAEILDLVELGHRTDAYPHELSGGQQQRVALARALVHGPSVLLLDEPFSNLDAKLRERARDWLKTLQRTLGITTVFVTHDQTEALAMSDQIIVMNRGRITRAGTPEQVYRDPQDRFTAEFLGRCSFLTGTATPADADLARLSVPGLPTPLFYRATDADAPDAGTVTLAIRPEDLTLAEETGAPYEPGSFPATLERTVFLGEAFLHTLKAGPHTLTALSPQKIPSGEVRVTLQPDAPAVIRDPPETAEDAPAQPTPATAAAR
jgi:iron(III) transport system ATP-binding protein